MPFICNTYKKQLRSFFCVCPYYLLVAVMCGEDPASLRGKTVITHIIHLPKCCTRTQKAKMRNCTTPGCAHAKCRSGSSGQRELMAVSGAPNTCSGSFSGHRGVECRAPRCWLSHLRQPASSPCPPSIDLIWPGDKAVIGWGLGIRLALPGLANSTPPGPAGPRAKGAGQG